MAFRRNHGRQTFVDRLAQSCEYLLVEAAERAASESEWSLRSRRGNQYKARLVVDEWTDSPIIEVLDPEKDDAVVQRFGIGFSCWPLR
jgi:hypothetical protein